MTHFAGVHGTSAQRFYNVVCIAYGADKHLFGDDIVEKGYLPKERAEDCENEYRQVAYAYEKLIGPQELIVIASIIAAATFSLGFFTGFAVRLNLSSWRREFVGLVAVQPLRKPAIGWANQRS
jgi:hypothetical protein